MKTLQLNKNLVAQLENVIMLFNAAAGFAGQHIAFERGTFYDYACVEIARRITVEVTDCDGTHFEEDMATSIIAYIESDEDVADAIIQVTTMLIKFNLGK